MNNIEVNPLLAGIFVILTIVAWWCVRSFKIRPNNKYLRFISKPIIIGPCDGSETIAEASDTFAYISPDFKGLGTNKKSSATGPTPVKVYGLRKDATFARMFGKPDRVCLSQHQVKKFCQENENRQYFSCGAGFIPFRVEAEKDGEKDEFYVARVDVDVNSDGALKVHMLQFEYSHVWHAAFRHRVVVPQLRCLVGAG